MAGYRCKSTCKNGIHNYLALNNIQVKHELQFCINFLEQIYPNLHEKKCDWTRVSELVQNNWAEFKIYVHNLKQQQL